MKTIIKTMVLAAALIVAWSCSSDDGNEEPQPGFSTTASFSATSTPPDWHIDWSWHDAAPSWQAPDASKFEFSMNVLLELSQSFLPYSTDDDPMAMFINGECRGIGYRNVYSDGSVYYLLHVKGHGEDTERHMELRYYNTVLKHQFVYDFMPLFTPNDLLDDPHNLIVNPGEGNAKYPYDTELSVMPPDELPFTVTNDDMVAVFVDGECRGTFVHCEDLFPGWRGIVYSYKNGEVAQVRYYSAEKQGVYTIGQTFTLNNSLQTVNIQF